MWGEYVYSYICVYFLRGMSLTLIKILKRFNAIKYNYVVSVLVNLRKFKNEWKINLIPAAY